MRISALAGWRIGALAFGIWLWAGWRIGIWHLALGGLAFYWYRHFEGAKRPEYSGEKTHLD